MWLLLAGLSVACGSAPASPPQAPSVPAPPPAPSAAERPPAPPDVSEVAEPAGLVLVGKVSHLQATMATLAAWTGKSFSPNDAITSVIADEAVPFVDAVGPIDFAVLVSPAGFALHPRTAVSVALRDPSADGTRLAERFKLVPQGNGVSLIQASGSHHADKDSEEDNPDLDVCEVAPAFGPAPTRLVCGSDAKALAELAPWLTRTATRSTATADATLNVRLQPLRALMKIGRGFASTYLRSAIDRHLGGLPIVKELGGFVVDDLVDFGIDLDAATFDITTSDSQLALSAALKFSGHQATLTRLLTAHPERTAPAPAAFWRLPAEANAACFDRGGDESALARLRTVIASAIGRSFGKDGLKDPEQKLLVDALGNIFWPAAGVVASGFDDDAVSAAVAALHSIGAKATKQQTDSAESAIAEARGGWLIGSIEAPIAEVAGRVRSLGVDLDRIAAALAPRSKSSSNGVPLLRAAPLPKGPQWPASAQHFVLTIPAGDPPTNRVVGQGPTVHIVLAPEGGSTWLALEGRGERLAKRLADAMAGTGKNLGSRSELGAFKSEVGAGGFFTLRLAEGLKGAQSSLPHQGKVPIPFSVTSQTGGDSVVMSLRIPKDAIEDVSAGTGFLLP